MRNPIRLFFFLLICVPFSSLAGHTIRTDYLSGDDIKSGAVLEVRDDYYNISFSGVDYKKTGRVRLYFTEQLKKFHTDEWELEVDFKVQYYYNSNTPFSTQNKQLKISYDPVANYVDEQVIDMAGANRVKVTINGINAVRLSVDGASAIPIPANDYDDIFLQVETDVERYFTMSTTATIGINHANIDTYTKEIFWPYFQGAEEYDVEWYFSCAECADNITSPSDIDPGDFTRVTVTNNHFQLNLHYDDGTLWYRVRPVGRHGTGYAQRLEGLWSDDEDNKITVANPEEQKNWTYNAIFAEDGKMKEVVLYADGSGNSRQTVTRLNTQDVAIIGESFYDYEGRGVIQTLPVPDELRSTHLKFYADFSLNAAGSHAVLNKKDYDKDPSGDACATENIALWTDEGAGNYFSADNVFNDAYNAYLPKGTHPSTATESYTYTRVVYGRDGRAKKQSGVGYDHRIGSGHEVTFNYAAPYQQKLDRMFGNEVGFAEHYRVTQTIDPNGQASLSYTDLEGKVIATSLVGLNPSSLVALDSKPTTAAEFTADFNNVNKWKEAEGAYEINNTFLVEFAGLHTFEYTMTPEQFESLCGDEGGDCQYVLELALYDECKNKIYEDDYGDTEDDTLYLHTKRIVNSSTTFPFVMEVTFDSPGIYSIYKRLSLHEPSVQADIDTLEAALPGTCTTLVDFQEIYEGSIDWSNCDECDSETEDCGEIPTPSCEQLLFVMMEDMSPGGQYFDNLLVTGTSGGGINDWLNLHVKNELASDADDFFDNLFGTNPVITSWNDVRNNWGAVAGWAELLAEYHPEYCHYRACSLLVESTEWDMNMQSINGIDDAVTAGYIPNNAPSCSDIDIQSDHAYPMSTTGPAYQDPFYADYATSGQRTAMYNYLYTNSSSCLWLAAGAVCSTLYSCTNCDKHWQIYRDMYLGKKYEHIEEFKSGVCNNWDPSHLYDGFVDVHTATTYYLCDNAGFNISNNAIPNDLVADNCGNNGAWHAIGRWIRVPDISYLINEIDDIADDDEAGNIGDDLADWFDPCTGAFPVATVRVSEEITCSRDTIMIKIAGLSIIDTLDLSDTIFDNPALLADTLAKAINDYISDPDYKAVAYGDDLVIWCTVADTIYNGDTVSVRCNGTVKTVTTTTGGSVPPGSPCVDLANCVCDRIQSDINLLLEENTGVSGYDLEDAQTDLAAYYTDFYDVPSPYITQANIDTWMDLCDAENYDFTSTNIPTAFLESCAPLELPCDQNEESINLANYYAEDEYNEYVEGLLEQFEVDYRESCLPQTETQLSPMDQLTVTALDYEYHFTLYYYDQAGNLTRTVPPAGVNLLDADGIAKTSDHRNNPTDYTKPFVHTLHEMISGYEYNSLNQVVRQYMPDALATVGLQIQNPDDYHTALGSSSKALGDVHMFDELKGIAILSNSSSTDLYETSDGGLTWQAATDNVSSSTLRQIEFVTPSHGFVIGDNAYAYEITNYVHGANNSSWASISSVPGSVDLYAMTFIEEDYGYIVGENGTVLRVTSGTAYDLTSHVGTSEDLYAATSYGSTLSTGILYIAGSNNYAVRLTDLNNLSTPTVDDISLSSPAVSFSALDAFNNGLSILAGASSSGGTARIYTCDIDAASPPSSVTWTQRVTRTTGSLATVPDVLMNENGQGYALALNIGGSPSSQLYVTSDFGVNWTAITSNTDIMLSISPTVSSGVIIGGVNCSMLASAKKYAQRFWYDDLGRIKASQNARQAAFSPDPAYSYIAYDEFGRPTEAGQVYDVNDPRSGDPTRPELNDTGWPGNWINSARYEVSYTAYDEPIDGIVSAQFTNGQQNLRTRVGTTWFKNVSTGDTAYATHYSYDVHGNVEELVQDFPALEDEYDQRFKKLEYSYDLISGNVNMVCYQRGEADAYYHEYVYDADNRVTHAFTSRDSLVWDNDVKYFYYLHGPLARTETGDKKVQGKDYAYTIHGWLKGANSNNLDYTDDMGKDGYPHADVPTNEYMLSPNDKIHNNVARDAFGFTLGYYAGDYNAITSFGNDFLHDVASVNSSNAGSNLYNGNVRHMATALLTTDESPYALTAAVYTYDQLNRLKSANYWQHTTSYASATTGASGNELRESYSYDPNGNITKLNRYGYSRVSPAQVKDMDSLSYNYFSGTNKLEYVDDIVNGSNYGDDIDDQSTGNYDYDEMGNLISDDAENITSIEWMVNGKVKSVTKTSGEYILFEYNAMGQRVRKYVQPDAPQDDWYNIYYVRDAQGNLISMYKQYYYNIPSTNDYLEHFRVEEQDIYGGNMVGVNTLQHDLYRKEFSCSTFTAQGLFDDVYDESVVTISESEHLLNQRNVGQKQYNLQDHRGNVYVSVTDRRIAVDDGSNGTTDFWTADVVNWFTYSSFGAIQPFDGNLYPAHSTAGANNRWGFQGQERDDELKGEGNSVNFDFRMHDPRLGRFFALDPLMAKYPHNSPYAFSENVVINAVELEGLEKWVVVDNNIDGPNPSPRSEVVGMSGKNALKDEMFGPVLEQMKAELLIHDISEIKFKAIGMGTEYGSSSHTNYMTYTVTWSTYDFMGDIVCVDATIDVPFSSVHVNGSCPLDYVLEFVFARFYSKFLPKTIIGRGIIKGGKIIQEKARAAMKGSMSALAEIKVAKFLREKGINVTFLEPATKAASEADFLINGAIKADVKYMILDKNTAGNLAKGAQQVGEGGTIYWVRPQGAKASLSEMQDFAKKFVPKDAAGNVIKNVKIEVIDYVTLPGAFGK